MSSQQDGDGEGGEGSCILSFWNTFFDVVSLNNVYFSRQKGYPEKFQMTEMRMKMKKKKGTILRKLSSERAAIKRQRQSFPRPTLFTLLAAQRQISRSAKCSLRDFANHKHRAIRILQSVPNISFHKKVQLSWLNFLKTEFPPACYYM